MTIIYQSSYDFYNDRNLHWCFDMRNIPHVWIHTDQVVDDVALNLHAEPENYVAFIVSLGLLTLMGHAD